AGQAYRGVLRRKATVIEQPASREPLERRVYGRGGMLPLNEPPPQIGARVRAPAQRAERGPVGGFDIGELLQPPEHRARKLAPHVEPKAVQSFGREGSKPPPIYLHQAIARLPRIGGESREDRRRHSVLGRG